MCGQSLVIPTRHEILDRRKGYTELVRQAEVKQRNNFASFTIDVMEGRKSVFEVILVELRFEKSDDRLHRLGSVAPDDVDVKGIPQERPE